MLKYSKFHFVIIELTFCLLADGMMLTAEFKFMATGGGGDGTFFVVKISFSLAFGAAVTVIPLVARIFATALASDFLGLGGFGGGFLTDNVIESDKCIILLSTMPFDAIKLFVSEAPP